MKNQLLIIAIAGLIMVGCSKHTTDYDIIIYSGNASGVIAGYSAQLIGKKVLIVEPRIHLGGMTTGGLGATDIGNKYAVTGIARNFYRRLGNYYNKLEQWEFEPHVAEKIMNDYIREANVEVIYKHRLVSVEKKNGWIRSITVENSEQPGSSSYRTLTAKMFIDCSYEGDLMAKAGVSYTIGREDNKEYNETLNGVQLRDKHQFEDSINPYIVPGDSSSGLCWGISSDTLEANGTGDKRVQAYNYRLCLTNDTANMIPISRPANYDSTRYELLRRVIKAKDDKGWKQPLGSYYLRIVQMPELKTDINNKGPFSTDMIGMNYNYPEANYEIRAQIEKEHENYIRGLLYFLGHDPALPEGVKKQMLEWGWAKDEFTDNNYFPFQMYVREARRMIGAHVMTEHHCTGKEVVDDGVGMAAYTMDSHNCRRLVVNGKVQNEGDVQVGGFPPYPVSYRCLTPVKKECKNLLVPVCLSATHIAYGSIRMEPVFMVLAQSAAMAASMAIDAGKPVQKINIRKLQQWLTNDPLLNGTPPEIMIDNEDTIKVSYSGYWKINKKMGQNKKDCLVSDSLTGQQRRVKFITGQPVNGTYDAYFYCPAISWENPKNPIPASVPLIISSKGNSQVIMIDYSQHQRDWFPLGRLELNESSTFELVADTVHGIITADALLLIPITE